MITKQNLDDLVKKYETTEFIVSDPIQFAHRFKNKKDIEIAGFLASLFAYGSRKLFIPKLNELFTIMSNKPYNYILNFTPQNKALNNFNYRFSKGNDIKEIILILNKLYKNENSSLEELFKYGWKKHKTIKGMLITVSDYFYSSVRNEVGAGFYHLIPDANKSSALKRMNMFLRWMIRTGPVDIGIWNFIPKSELIIPLDVHVGRISTNIGLIKKSNGDYKSALEITNALKLYDKNDPIKYDFALFGYGINN